MPAQSPARQSITDADFPAAPARARAVAPADAPADFAILCAGLDRVRRGYETHSRTLFDALDLENRPELRFTLFKRSGPRAPGEISLHTPYRDNPVCRLLGLLKGDALFWESVFFAIGFALFAHLTGRRFDKIVVIEPVVAKMLRALKRLLPGDPRLLFTHGVCNPPEDYVPVADEVHEVNVENFRQLESYLARSPGSVPHHTLAPHFIAEESRRHDKEELRAKYNISTSRVLLSVGAVESEEKRMDYIIDETIRLGDDWTLVLCGKAVDRELLGKAKRELGDRFLHLFMDSGDMEEVYRLADVFVTASLQEGFGIVILEAMRAELPVITHRRDLFQWILQSDQTCIDMTEPGNLSGFLTRTSSRRLASMGVRNRELFEKNYTWEAVKDAYYAMLTWKPEDADGESRGFADRLKFYATRYFHRIFSRYFPRKLRRRLARWTCSAIGVTYPRPRTKIADFRDVLSDESGSAIVFIAHPDDEMFCSGLLCALRRENVAVTLCCLTRGEGGFTGAHTRDEIGAVREKELRNAARVLGIDDVRFLGHVDPVPTEHRNFAPKVKGNRLNKQIHDLLAELQPGLVLTHGSCGEYWHPAHILLHDHVVKAVARWNRRNSNSAKLLTFNAFEQDHPLRPYLNESDASDLTVDGADFHITRLESLLCHRTQEEVFRIFANGSVGDFVEATSRENYRLVNQRGADLQSAVATMADCKSAPLSHAP